MDRNMNLQYSLDAMEVESFDSSLTLRRDLGTGTTFEVERKGQEGKRYVLKFQDGAIIPFMRREIDVLEAGRDCLGMVDLVEVYTHRPGYLGILKEYWPGQEVPDFFEANPNADAQKIKAGLQETVTFLHGQQIAYLELFKRNVIVGVEGRIKLFDLDCCIINGQPPVNMLCYRRKSTEEHIQKDLSDVDRLFEQYAGVGV